jgi:hypothetical protein
LVGDAHVALQKSLAESTRNDRRPDRPKLEAGKIDTNDAKNRKSDAKSES